MFLSAAWIALWTIGPAQGTTIDDFESYGDTAQLVGKWTVTLGIFSYALETGEVFSGDQSMKVTGGYDAIPINVLKYTFATAQNWTGATSVKIRYKGSGSNDPIDIEMQLLSSGNTEIVDKVISSGALGATWQELTIPLSGQTGLDDVKALQIAVGPGFPGWSSTVYFDELTVEFPSANADVTVVETAGSTEVTEGGVTDTLNVSIASAPTHDVVVAPVFDSSQIGVTPATRTITPGNWETPVSFTCSAVNDDWIEGEQSSGLSFSTASTDPAYSGLNSANLFVGITDNDFLLGASVVDFITTGGNMTFNVHTEANQHYTIQESETMLEGSWTPYIGPITGLVGTINVSIPMNNTRRFYRVFTEPSPAP